MESAVEAENGKAHTFSVSRARWWVLFVYSFFTFLQGAQWNYPGPIAPLIESSYGLSGESVQLLLNYGPIFYILCAIPFAFWMDTPHGLRGSVICGAALVFASAAARLLCQNEGTLAIAAMHVSFILNASAGPVAMAAVTRLTEVWFPFHERATATAIAAEANVLGGALSSLAGPLIVTTGTQAQFLVYNIMFIALAGAGLLAALVYFPALPALPPSESAYQRARTAKREPLTWAVFWKHNCALVRNTNFMLLCFACGITNGMSSSWGSTISLDAASVISTVDAGWIGFAQAVGGNFGGILSGWIVDRTRAHKSVLVGSFALSFAFTLWFALVTQNVLPPAWPGLSGPVLRTQVFVTSITAVVLLNCSWPVFYELSAEDSFPVPEATSLMMLTTIYNFGALLLLFVPIQSAAPEFNWINVSTLLLFTLLLLFFYVPQRTRSQIDEAAEEGAALCTEATVVDGALLSTATLIDGTTARAVVKVDAAMWVSDGGVSHAGKEPLLRGPHDHASLNDF